MTKSINILLSLLVLSAAWISCNDKQSNPEIKLGYVRSGDLIVKYKGTEEADAKLKKQAESWGKEEEILAKAYNDAFTKYNQEASRMSFVEKTNLEEQLKKLEEKYQNLQGRAKKTNEEAMKVVFDKINKYVEKFGKDNHYTMILGTQNVGTILYADSLYDLTDTILVGLNKEYEGGGAIIDSTSSK